MTSDEAGRIVEHKIETLIQELNNGSYINQKDALRRFAGAVVDLTMTRVQEELVAHQTQEDRMGHVFHSYQLPIREKSR